MLLQTGGSIGGYDADAGFFSMDGQLVCGVYDIEMDERKYEKLIAEYTVSI